MTLRDHFHPPLSKTRHWQGFYCAWASEIVRQLNKSLPERFYCEPLTKIRNAVDPGPTTPIRAPLRAAIDLAGLETFEVRVMNDEEGPRLASVLELVSPGNKDRTATRRAFCTRCASHLQDNVCVVVVDIVTSRSANLVDDVLADLRVDVSPWPSSPELYAVTLRTVPAAANLGLEIWSYALSLGTELPTVPLWLSPELALPVELQSSYEATCRLLRIAGT